MCVAAYLIHLSRAKQRRPVVERLVGALPMPVQILEAVDAAALDETVLAARVARVPLFWPAYPFALTKGEVGCFLSHRNAWRKIVESGVAQGLVIEDDVALTADFARAFAAARRVCGEDGYVQFQTRPVKGWTRTVTTVGGVSVIEPVVVQRRTSAQLVGRLAALRLLAASEQIDRPVDVFLQHFWETGQKVRCVVPSGVSDVTQEAGGTTVQSKVRRGIAEQLQRDVSRATFRAALSVRSFLAHRPQ